MLNLLPFRDPYTRFARRPFLVADWGTTGVVLSEIRQHAGRPEVVRSEYLPWPSTTDRLSRPAVSGSDSPLFQSAPAESALQESGGNGRPPSAEETGAWLSDICSRLKYPTNAAAISVSRRDLSLKLLELPNVSDDELGPLVALQVESRVQSTGQSVAWDCIPHPSRAEDTHRYVLLATVPAAVLDRIRCVAQAAGWSNLVITSGDLLISNIGLSHESAWQMHVQANRTKLELQLTRQGLPVTCCATAMPVNGSSDGDGIEAAAVIVQSMSSRLLAAVPGALRNKGEVPSLVLAGLHTNELLKRLSTVPSAGRTRPTLADERTPRAMAVALSLSDSQRIAGLRRKDQSPGPMSGINRIDFLRPRSTDGRRVHRQYRLMQIAAVVTLVLSLFAVGLWVRYSSLKEELARLNDEREQMQQFVDRGEDVVGKWSYVSRWQKETLPVAQEIRHLAMLLPSRERLIVTRLQLENVADAEDSTLRIDGMAQSPEDVLQMNASLLGESGRYDLRPQGIEPAPAGSSFPSQFRVEAVLKQNPEGRFSSEQTSAEAAE